MSPPVVASPEPAPVVQSPPVKAPEPVTPVPVPEPVPTPPPVVAAPSVPFPVVAAPGVPPPVVAEPSAPTPVSSAKSASSLDALVVQNDEQAFRLENGISLHGVKELREYLPTMDDGLFRNHVGFDYNHFADWISGVFHDEDLARKVGRATTKQELIAALS
jgi:hypothetical protein